jgi:hypothetical protein
MIDYLLNVAVGISSGIGTLVSAVRIVAAGGHPRAIVEPVRVTAGNRRSRDMVAAQGIRQRLHRSDRSGGGKQRGAGFPRAGGSGRPQDPSGDHYYANRAAGGHCSPGALLPHHRDDTRPAWIRERFIEGDSGGSRQGCILPGFTMFSVLLVLCLSANTSFADFPRLCRAVAVDDYLPHSLATRGRRLVYSQGIVVLAVFAAILLILFGGITDRLIPLFAVGAFLAFTLSQAGMVAHWRRTKGPAAVHSMLFNGLGAVATGITVLVVVAAKFSEVAWVVVLLLPAALLLMARVRRHYRRVAQEVQLKDDMILPKQHPPIVIVPMERWNAATQKALPSP